MTSGFSGSLRAFPVVADNPEVMPKIFFSSWLTGIPWRYFLGGPNLTIGVPSGTSRVH